MIRYALSCAESHQFESWFKSADAFDELRSSRLVSCPVCGSNDVTKSLMAPGVAAKGNKATEATQAMSSGPDPKVMQAIRELREHVEKTSDYVGAKFAEEARAMHLGEKPERSIYGEVRPEEAKALRDDGIPAVPLPFTPKQKTN